MKKNWPIVRKSLNHGNEVWIVDARFNGSGSKKYFQVKAEADRWAKIQRDRRRGEGEAAFDDKELATFGWTVADAIKFSLEHLRAKQKSVPVSQAVEEFIAVKVSAGRLPSYTKLLGWNLEKLTKRFLGKTVAEIDKADLDAFFTSLAVGDKDKGVEGLAPQTINTVRRDCVSLWTFCVSSGYADKNVAELSEVASVIPKAPHVLTPAQAESLLKAAKDDDIRAFVAIALFAGLRVHEIKKLAWKDVDLEDGTIHVTAAMDTKRKARRSVPIQPNLKTILTPLKKDKEETEKIVNGKNFRRRWVKTRELAGISRWEDGDLRNCMRHSFVSYRLAAKNDRAGVASEAGHAQAVLESNYLNLVKNADTVKWWKIGLRNECLPNKWQG